MVSFGVKRVQSAVTVPRSGLCDWLVAVLGQRRSSGGARLVLLCCGRVGPGSAGGWERVEALERAEDRGGPGPVSGEVQRRCPGVTGQLSGDVQDPVTEPLGLCEPVLAVERELLGPDDQIVGAERELKPRGVRLERVEREARDAGRFHGLDAVLDLRVLTVVVPARRDRRRADR